MRVFVAYADADRVLAERLADQLRQCGHAVSLSADAPAENGSLEAVLDGAELLVYLVSPESVTAPEPLATLAQAQRQWPAAARRVLPVLVRPTPEGRLPGYLRAPTLLVPAEDPVAETAAAVNRRARRRPLALRAALLLLVALAAVIVTARIVAPRTGPEVLVRAQLPSERARPGAPAVDNIVFEIRNAGAESVALTTVALTTGPAGGLTVVSSGPALTPDEPATLEPGETWTGHFKVRPARDPVGTFRICATFDALRRVCSPGTVWITQDPERYRYSDGFPIPEFLHGASAVTWNGNAYVVAKDRLLLELSEVGRTRTVASFPAPVLALHRSQLGLYVALGTGSVELLRLDPVTFQPIVHRLLTAPGARARPDPGPEERAAGQPRIELADDGQRLWLLAAHAGQEPLLAHLAPDLTGLTAPPYTTELGEQLGDLSLHSGAGMVWATVPGTTVGSVHRFLPATHARYAGRTHEVLACATDLHPQAGFTVVPDCQGRLNRLEFSEGGVRFRGVVDQLPGAANVDDQWSTVTLAAAPEGRLLAAIETESLRAYGGDGARRLVVVRVAWPDEPAIAFDLKGLRLKDFAAGRASFLLLAEDERGRAIVLAPPSSARR